MKEWLGNKHRDLSECERHHGEKEEDEFCRGS